MTLATNGFTITAESGPAEAPEAGNWLIEHVGEWLQTSTMARHDPHWFHPSDLGNDDDEELINCFMGRRTDKPFSPRQLRVFDNGHNRDMAWKGYLKGSKLSLVIDKADRQIRIPHLRLRGECDDIVRDPTTGEVYVFEFKTKNTYKHGQLREPDVEHVLQVHAYMAGLAIYQSLIVYEDKNTQALKAFTQPFDAEIWRSIEERLLRLLQAVKDRRRIR